MSLASSSVCQRKKSALQHATNRSCKQESAYHSAGQIIGRVNLWRLNFVRFGHRVVVAF